MYKSCIPAMVLVGAATAGLSAVPPAQAAQRFTITQAAEKAKVNLNPNEGVYIQLPATMPIFTYSIDDGSVLTLGDKFSPGNNIMRIVGKNPGKTGLGLVVQGSSGYQTLNLSVHVGSKGSQGTIEIIEDSASQEEPSSAKATDAALSKSSYPSDLVRSGLSFANIQGQIPTGSPLDLAVNRWIEAVDQGASEDEASRQTGVQSNVLQKLVEMGQTTPVVQAMPASKPEISPTSSLPPDVQPDSEPTEAVEVSEVVTERIAELEKQVQANTKKLSKQQQILAQIESQQQTFLARFDAIDAQSEQFLAQLGDLKETASDLEESESVVAQAPAPEPLEAEAESEAKAEVDPVAQPDEQLIVVADESKELPPEATESETDAPAVPVIREQPPEEADRSSDEMTPIELAHAIKQGLHRNSEDYPYSSWKYRQVNNAVRILKRGNSIETASKWSGLEIDTLRHLAGLPQHVSQGGV